MRGDEALMSVIGTCVQSFIGWRQRRFVCAQGLRRLIDSHLPFEARVAKQIATVSLSLSLSLSQQRANIQMRLSGNAPLHHRSLSDREYMERVEREDGDM